MAEQLQAAAASQKLRQQAISRPHLRPRSHHRDSLWSIPEDKPSNAAQTSGPGASAHAKQATGSSQPPSPAQAGASYAAAKVRKTPASSGPGNPADADRPTPYGTAAKAGSIKLGTINAAPVAQANHHQTKGKCAHGSNPKNGGGAGLQQKLKAGASAKHDADDGGWTLVAPRPSKKRAQSPANASVGSSGSCASGGKAPTNAVQMGPGMASNARSGPSSAEGQSTAAKPAPALIPGAKHLQAEPKTATAKRNAARQASLSVQRRLEKMDVLQSSTDILNDQRCRCCLSICLDSDSTLADLS